MSETAPARGAADPRPVGPTPVFRLAVLVVLRVAVGWHLLYEGLVRLLGGEWTSERCLELPGWAFAPVFRWIASSPGLLGVVDFVGASALVVAGAGLILGCFTRASAGLGVFLFLLWYVAHPPLVGVALFVVIVFPTGAVVGLDRFIGAFLRKKRAGGEGPAPAGAADGIASEVTAVTESTEGNGKGSSSSASSVSSVSSVARPRGPLGRREVLAGLASVPFLGAFLVAVLRGRGWRSFEEEHLVEEMGEKESGPSSGEAPAALQGEEAGDREGAREGAAEVEEKADAVTSATIKTFDFPTLKQLNGQVPHSRILDMPLSRLVLGGNLIGGWAHARDLIYVSKLVKAYHHKWKVFETFTLAEKCGVNTILTNPALCGVINEYWKRRLGRIQFISDCGGSPLLRSVKKSIDNGAAACYVQGGTADKLVKQGKLDEIAKALELTRKNGLPAGIGAHSIETVKACVKRGLEPDFWMKTLHEHSYWSAKPKERHDNIWCYDPAETIAVMRDLPQPWIAFKILAAGAIDPRRGFPYAFRSGADFICVGMYDFQIVEDVNIALKVLGGNLKRERPWRAPILR